jgi:hypothetical protein
MHDVRRFALALIVAALSISASGLSSLIVGEPCAGFSVAAEHDSDVRECRRAGRSGP